MTIEYNERFGLLMKEYDLPADLSFTTEIPAAIQRLINAPIHVNERGVTMGENKLYVQTEAWQNRSVIEDDTNHFHVEAYASPDIDKYKFMLGVKTLILLAKRFQELGHSGVRLWFHFLTAELGREWAIAHGLHEEGDTHYTSDRLSFFTRRAGEDVVSINKAEDWFSALLIVDI